MMKHSLRSCALKGILASLRDATRLLHEQKTSDIKDTSSWGLIKVMLNDFLKRVRQVMLPDGTQLVATPNLDIVNTTWVYIHWS